jgi:hypothetical protein
MQISRSSVGFGALAVSAGLDAERVRRWLIARCVQDTLREGPPWPALDAIIAGLGRPRRLLTNLLVKRDAARRAAG